VGVDPTGRSAEPLGMADARGALAVLVPLAGLAVGVGLPARARLAVFALPAVPVRGAAGRVRDAAPADRVAGQARGARLVRGAGADLTAPVAVQPLPALPRGHAGLPRPEPPRLLRRPPGSRRAGGAQSCPEQRWPTGPHGAVIPRSL